MSNEVMNIQTQLIAEYKTQIERLVLSKVIEKEAKGWKDDLKKAMESHDIKSLRNDDWTITLTKASTTTKEVIDRTMFNKLVEYIEFLEIPELLEMAKACIQEEVTERKPSLRIEIKEKEND